MRPLELREKGTKKHKPPNTMSALHHMRTGIWGEGGGGARRPEAGEEDQKWGEGQNQVGRNGSRVFQKKEKANNLFCFHRYTCSVSPDSREKTQKRLLLTLLLGFQIKGKRLQPS